MTVDSQFAHPQNSDECGSFAAASAVAEIEGRAAKSPHVGKHDRSVIERLQDSETEESA
jgi:hypothetical protein